MDTLSIDQLNELRLIIFDNAESFYKEAQCLHENGFYARAYLSAYYTLEELGKIPMIVGALGKLVSNNAVDWKKFNKRFRNHVNKIESEVHHHYVFGIDPSPFNKDVEWYQEKIEQVNEIYKKKNVATYVDVISGKIINPLKEISKDESKRAIEEAFDALKAHWASESISNKIIIPEQGATADHGPLGRAG